MTESSLMHMNPMIQTLSEIIYVDSHDRFLELLEDKLTELSTLVCATAKKNTSVENYKSLFAYSDEIACPIKRKSYIADLEKKLEDDISIQLINLLNQNGFDAGHEDFHNGHVDIVIKSHNKKFKWLGEAKLYGGNKYSEKGLYQLINDYSLGKLNESGGVLIYLNSTQYSVKKVMQNWDSHLKELSKDTSNRLNSFTSEFKIDKEGKQDSSIFYSTHEHHRSGDPYRIRHCCLDIRIDF
ncbi:hypothetical protein [Acinetobacter sp. YH12239]|uniref:hypothetical protein n=1 Tax=Acinetobacter sp. YH12239 TaxID=2601166 RepID=UPI001C552B8B|nr:hypothetical protein [Acinetobacter sp. YH12239]